MSSVVPAEPCARGTIFKAFRAAAQELWGEAVIAARIPEETRGATIDTMILLADAWLPERYVIDWYEAAWSGPCGQQPAAFRTFIDRMMDHGFGRVRRLMLNLITPHQLADRAGELWRHDHTHGTLTCEHLGERAVRMILSNHPYTIRPLSRMAVAEIYRYAASLTRVRNVEESHLAVAPASAQDLEIDLHWR